MTHENQAPEESINSQSRRRRWLMGAAAGAAALGAIGLVWPDDVSPSATSAAVAAALWSLEFEQPDGMPLPLRTLRGKPLLLNFWATWCPPCVDELPLLSDFYRENQAKGWQVLGLAVDQRAPVQHFLRQTPLAFPVALAGAAGLELSRSLGNLSGGLPFTVLLGSDGVVAHRKMGKVTPADLRSWALLK